jgi:putative FmdB family regulatory protein
MPMFDYHCTACQAGFERLMKLSDPLPACPACGATTVERILSRLAPVGKSGEIIASARKQAAREGHFSHYSKAERSKLR